MSATFLPSASVSCQPLPTFASTSLNWDTLTASISFVPAATLLMALPPLSRPVFVSLTAVFPVCRVPGVNVMLLAFCWYTLLAASLVVTPSAVWTVEPLVGSDVVTLEMLISLFKPYVKVFSPWTSVRLLSLAKVTVSPAFTACTAPELLSALTLKEALLT